MFHSFAGWWMGSVVGSCGLFHASIWWVVVYMVNMVRFLLVGGGVMQLLFMYIRLRRDATLSDCKMQRKLENFSSNSSDASGKTN